MTIADRGRGGHGGHSPSSGTRNVFEGRHQRHRRKSWLRGASPRRPRRRNTVPRPRAGRDESTRRPDATSTARRPRARTSGPSGRGASDGPARGAPAPHAAPRPGSTTAADGNNSRGCLPTVQSIGGTSPGTRQTAGERRRASRPARSWSCDCQSSGIGSTSRSTRWNRTIRTAASDHQPIAPARTRPNSQDSHRHADGGATASIRPSSSWPGHLQRCRRDPPAFRPRSIPVRDRCRIRPR